MKRAPRLLPPRVAAAPAGSRFESPFAERTRRRGRASRACAPATRREEKEKWTLMFLPLRPRRELASVLAPTQRRVPLREMAPPRGRRRDEPRASGVRRCGAARPCGATCPPPDFFQPPTTSELGRRPQGAGSRSTTARGALQPTDSPAGSGYRRTGRTCGRPSLREAQFTLGDPLCARWAPAHSWDSQRI